MKTTKLTRYAIVCAIVLISILLDTMFKTVFLFQPAIVTMLTVTTICLLGDAKLGFCACLTFGLLSTVRGLVMTFDTFWLSFANPFVAVLPRVLIWVVIILVKKLFSLFIHNEIAVNSLSALIGVFSNTVFCALMMILFKVLTGSVTDIVEKVIIPFFSINCVIEAVVCAVVTPFLVKGLRGKFNLED